MGEYSSVWHEICRLLSQIQWSFVRGILGKKLFREIFSEILCKPRLSILCKNLWNLAILSEILFWVPIALKIFTQVPSYVVCTQVRRPVHKQIIEGRYGLEKPGRFFFGKLVFFTLGLRLTTRYSLGILVWNFYQTVVTVSTEFWLRFEIQIRSTRLTINFLFITHKTKFKMYIYSGNSNLVRIYFI